MKKILFAFLVCASYLAPVTVFSQANKYFHDRIDTTIYATTTGTDAYTGTNTDPNFNVAGYVRGLMVSTFIVNGNTGACTYRLVTRTGALPVVAIKKQNGAALVAGDIPDSTAILLLYYGSYWRLEGLYSTASSAWGLTGNAGTVAGVNFLGTTDAIDLVFKTNNTEKARISSAGILSLGLASTNNGSLLFRNSTNANTLTINSGVTSASYALTLPTAQGAANSLLLNDGAGALSWNTGGGLFWGLTGNSGTNPATNFIGTTDANALVFKYNSSEIMRMNGTGLGIGTTPIVPLQIYQNTNSSWEGMYLNNPSAGLNAITIFDIGEDVNNFSQIMQIGSGNSGAANFGAAQDLAIYNTSGNAVNIMAVNGRINLFGNGNYNGGFPVLSAGSGGVGINLAVNTVPSALLQIKGSGATSATYWLKGDNSASSPMLYGRDDGAMAINSSSLVAAAALKVKGRLIVSTQEVTSNDNYIFMCEVGVGNGVLFSNGTNGGTLNNQLGRIFGDGGLQIYGRNASDATKFFFSGKASDNRMHLYSDNASDQVYVNSVGQLGILSVANQNAMQIYKDNAGTTLGTTYAALEVVNADATANRLSRIGFTNSASTANHAFLGARFVSATAGEMFFGTKTGGVEAIALTIDENQSSLFSGRSEAKQGADVASLNGAIAVGYDGNTFELTGTNSVTLLTSTGWQNGAEVTFVFTSTATIVDGTANSGADIGFECAGNANFVGSADDSITFQLSEIGGTQRWREKSRSVN